MATSLAVINPASRKLSKGKSTHDLQNSPKTISKNISQS